MTGIRRSIRLKEVMSASDSVVRPSERHHYLADETLLAEDYECSTDENGFIRTGNPGMANLKPLVFLGDSFVESMFARVTDRFVSQVERRLVDAGLPHRCLNGAYSGSTSLQILNVLINKVYPIVGHGGTVVMFAPHSDRSLVYEDGSYWSNNARFATIVPVSPPADDSISCNLESTWAVLNLVVDAAKRLGLNLVLATTPYRVAPFETDTTLQRLFSRDPVAYGIALGRNRDFCDLVREVAADTKTPFIDAEALMGGVSEYFYDELHLNRVGHEHFGHVLAKELQRILTPGA